MNKQPFTNVERATVLVALENNGEQTLEELVESTGLPIKLVYNFLMAESEISVILLLSDKWRLVKRDWRRTVREGGAA